MKKNIRKIVQVWAIVAAMGFVLSLGLYTNEVNSAAEDSSASTGGTVGRGGSCVPNDGVIECQSGFCCICGKYEDGSPIGNRCSGAGESCQSYCVSEYNSRANASVVCGGKRACNTSGGGCCNGDESKPICQYDADCNDQAAGQLPSTCLTDANINENACTNEPLERSVTCTNQGITLNCCLKGFSFSTVNGLRICLPDACNGVPLNACSTVPGATQECVDNNGTYAIQGCTIQPPPADNPVEPVENTIDGIDGISIVGIEITDRKINYRIDGLGEIQSCDLGLVTRTFDSYTYGQYLDLLAVSGANSNFPACAQFSGTAQVTEELYTTINDCPITYKTGRYYCTENAQNNTDVSYSLESYVIVDDSGTATFESSTNPPELISCSLEKDPRNVLDLDSIDYSSILLAERGNCPHVGVGPAQKIGYRTTASCETSATVYSHQCELNDDQISQVVVGIDEIDPGDNNDVVDSTNDTIEDENLNVDVTNTIYFDSTGAPCTRPVRKVFNDRTPKLINDFRPSINSILGGIDVSKITYADSCMDENTLYNFRMVYTRFVPAANDNVCFDQDGFRAIEDISVQCSEFLPQQTLGRYRNADGAEECTEVRRSDPEDRQINGQGIDQILANLRSEYNDQSLNILISCDGGFENHNTFELSELFLFNDGFCYDWSTGSRGNPAFVGLELTCKDPVSNTNTLESPNVVASDKTVLGVSDEDELSRIDKIVYQSSIMDIYYKNREGLPPEGQVSAQISEYVQTGSKDNVSPAVRTFIETYIENFACYGDLDSNGKVGILDLARYAKIYSNVNPEDGRLVSLSQFAQNYNKAGTQCNVFFRVSSSTE